MGASDMILSDALKSAIEAEKEVVVLKRTVCVLSALCALLGASITYMVLS